MATQKTKKLSEKSNRLNEIKNLMNQNDLEIDDVMPLTDEALNIYTELKDRLDGMLKILDEKEKQIKE